VLCTGVRLLLLLPSACPPFFLALPCSPLKPNRERIRVPTLVLEWWGAEVARLGGGGVARVGVVVAVVATDVVVVGEGGGSWRHEDSLKSSGTHVSLEGV